MLSPVQIESDCWPSVELFPHRRLFGWLARWNWKAAFLSAMIRAPIFLVTTHRYGWHSATLAAAVETTYCAGTAGIFAGIIQTLRNWRPVWLAALLITVGVPVVSQAFDYSLHLLMRTPNLRAGTMASFTFSELTALFNWYSMRRGTLLVGSGQDSFAHDLLRMPRMLAGFVLMPLIWAWRRTRRGFAGRGKNGN